MWLTRLSIRRPVLIAMAWLALGILGLWFFTALPVQLVPDVDSPVVTIATAYPGAGPQEVETLLTRPIEDAVGTVAGVQVITSSSQEALSTVVVQFLLGTSLDAASSAVREKVDAIRATLPQGARVPAVRRFSAAAQPVLTLSLAGGQSPQQLRDLADRTLKSRLEQISGVASVTVLGGEVREVQVNVDRGRLQAYGLTITQLLGTLTAENLNVPAGSISEGPRQYSIRALGQFQTLDDIRTVRVVLPSGGTTTVADLATVTDGVAEHSQLTRLNRKESVSLIVRRAVDANTIAVVDAVKGALKSLAGEHPELEVTVASDQSVFVRDALHDVLLALILGALLAVGIVFLFLHDVVSTMIIAFALPTSLLSAFIVIRWLGFTLNYFTMLGLSLSIGILVDDAIVVLENINRHLERGEPPGEAALNGRAEIGLAAVAITLVDVVVFVPIALTGGIVGQVLRPFGLTVAAVTLFSLFVAFTLTPMLAAHWLRARSGEQEVRGHPTTRVFAAFDRFYSTLDSFYERILRVALGRRGVVVAASLLSLALAVPLAMRLGFEFLPSPDQGAIGVAIEMPGGTSLALTGTVAAQMESRLAGLPEVQDILTTVGTSGGQTGPHYASMIVKLVDRSLRRRSDKELVRALQAGPGGSDIPGAKVVYTTTGVGLSGPPVDIRLSGTDFQQLDGIAAQIAERIRQVPGARDVDVSSRVGRPELQIRVDRPRASELGLNTGQITGILRMAIDGNTDLTFRAGGGEYPARVRMTDRGKPLAISDVPDVLIGTVNGQPIYTRDVATIRLATGPTRIDRRDRQRVIDVTAYVQPGYHAGNVNRAVSAAIRDIQPVGVKIEAGGEAQQIAETGGSVGVALVLAIVLVFILLAALFESLFTPLAIMLALPTALVGGILGLVLTGKTLSLVSVIGFILLTGLVMKNSILLVDYTNTLRARGKSRTEAILEAGPTRLRPVLMTTLAIILGSLPTALAFGHGSELRAPLAIAVIGGLVWSTLLTLVVIPVTYTLLDDLRGWPSRLLSRARPSPEPVSEGLHTFDEVGK